MDKDQWIQDGYLKMCKVNDIVVVVVAVVVVVVVWII